MKLVGDLKLNVMLDNKRGQLWDISDIVSDVQWTTSRLGKAGSLTFTYIRGGLYEDKSFAVNNGDIIRVWLDGANVFLGYVFEISFGMEENVSVKAYDQLRYLMNSDRYSFTGMTAAEIIRKIADDTGLKTADLPDTRYKIPSMLEDNKKLMDIICKALTLTLHNGKGNFVLYDDFGKLALKEINETLPDFFIGYNSLMTGYDFSRSIDNETYNFIKLAKEDKQAGVRKLYVAQDSVNIAQWGKLQLYQTVEEDQNDAQIAELLNNLALLRNRETRKLKLDALGDIRARAGSFITVYIPELELDQPMPIEECKHNFDGDHTMSLELKVI